MKFKFVCLVVRKNHSTVKEARSVQDTTNTMMNNKCVIID